MSKPFFISSSIPYVNARPHIGYALELVQADIIARYRRTRGDNVFFSAGTDDNALKNVQAAEAAGEPVAEYVARHSAVFRELTEKLGATVSDFISTSGDARHKEGAQKLWSACHPEDIYKKSYRGLYCVGCEEFKTEKDINPDGTCVIHTNKKVEEVSEENYFFRLSHYAPELKRLITSGELAIVPESRKNEMLAFIDRGLEDFSISRSRARAKEWGIPVPNDPSQVMYVWFDALANYITILGYANDEAAFQKYWECGTARMHCVGKDINRFHSIYWPAMLLSAGISLPTAIFVHGFITVDGQKMSKSLGNVVDPFELITEWGTDVTRYFLARLPTFDDGDFPRSRLTEIYNADLTNSIGNLLSRITKMASLYEVAPLTAETCAALGLPEVYVNAMEGYRVDRAVEAVFEHVAHIDGHIQKTEPFKTWKIDPGQAKKDVAYAQTELARIAQMLIPIMPQTAEAITNGLIAGVPSEPLFARKS